MFNAVEVSLPPLIASLDVPVSSSLVAELELATRAVSSLDQSRHAPTLQALGAMLLRTESVASSKIEHIDASIADYARALHGSRANASATSMVAATAAFEELMDAVTTRQEVTTDILLAAHRRLMADDLHEAAYAGRVRDVQNWIGGSDYSPRGALYVPPPAPMVDGYLADLIEFVRRDDVPTMMQAAIAHAQFESIHPFTDGNGRIGRALVNAVLRRRGATTGVVVPIASALVVQRDHYFSLLNRYRDGDVEPIVTAFARASRIAANESSVTAERLSRMPGKRRAKVGRVRTGSPTAQLLELIAVTPVFSHDDVAAQIKAPASSVYTAVSRLADAGVLEPLTESKRNRVWGTVDVLNEIDDLGVRIGVVAREFG